MILMMYTHDYAYSSLSVVGTVTTVPKQIWRARASRGARKAASPPPDPAAPILTTPRTKIYEPLKSFGWKRTPKISPISVPATSLPSIKLAPGRSIQNTGPLHLSPSAVLPSSHRLPQHIRRHSPSSSEALGHSGAGNPSQEVPTDRPEP